MRVKKTRMAPRSIRYLLRVDQRLQRISLKKISDRLRKAKQRRRPSRSKAMPASGAIVRSPGAMSTRALMLGLIPIVAAATLIAANQQSPAPAAARVRTPPESDTLPVAVRTQKPAPLANMPATTRVEAKKPASREQEPAAEPAVKTDARQIPSTTITGCLEHDDQAFWLKDASGAEAPKSRSWKSGFLRRRASRIELAGSPDTLQLTSYVGQRIAATGVLVDREMRPHSVRRLASSCD